MVPKKRRARAAKPETDVDEVAIEKAISMVVGTDVTRTGNYWTRCLDEPEVLASTKVSLMLRRGEFLTWAEANGRLVIRESETRRTDLGHPVAYFDRPGGD